MTELRQRSPRQEDRAHLAFVRTRPCCIKHCRRPAEAAHIRMACLAIGKEYIGKSEKPDDKWTVPLCPYHHRIGVGSQHSMGEADFWQMVGLNPFAIAAELWILSGGAECALVAKPPRKPKKIKQRKPAERRKKVPRGRPLKSNSTLVSRPFERRPATSAVEGGQSGPAAALEQSNDEASLPRYRTLDRADPSNCRHHPSADREALVAAPARAPLDSEQWDNRKRVEVVS